MFAHLETLWSVAKRNFDKLLLIEKAALTEARFMELVNLSLRLITVRALTGIIASNRSYIVRLLKQTEASDQQ